jgi:hypothetical protein
MTGTSDVDERAVELRRVLVAELQAEGYLSDPGWREAGGGRREAGGGRREAGGGRREAIEMVSHEGNSLRPVGIFK